MACFAFIERMSYPVTFLWLQNIEPVLTDVASKHFYFHPGPDRFLPDRGKGGIGHGAGKYTVNAVHLDHKSQYGMVSF